MKKKVSARKETPEWEIVPDPQLEVNVRLAHAHGYRTEIQDGICKMWPKGEEPGNENWIVLPDFVSDEVTNAELLDENGFQFFVTPEDDGLWVCRADDGANYIETVPHISEALALADGLLLALESKSQLT